MKATKQQQRGLISLLNRIYREILIIEEEWNIRGDEGDYRARIEYFHDAVRAFTDSGGVGSSGKDRLSVEMLAYDISMLRYIQAQPLPKPKSASRKLSPVMEVVHGLVPRAPGDKSGMKPDANVKSELSDQYKSYAVLFAALLCEAAEHNYMSRMEETNAQKEDMAQFQHSVAERNPEALIDVEALALEEIHDPEVMKKMLSAIQNGKLQKRMAAGEAKRKLKEEAKAIDEEAKAIEQAHTTYVMNQLAAYEGATEVIKKMAGKGLNIVGNFVESAVRDAMRTGRGM